MPGLLGNFIAPPEKFVGGQGLLSVRGQIQPRIDKRILTSLINKQIGIENIKRHSFENVQRGNTKGNSSVLSGSVQDSRLNNGKPTLIPFLYDGKIVNSVEAVKRALASGRQWPAFDTNEEATIVSKKISSGLGNKGRGE